MQVGFEQQGADFCQGGASGGDLLDDVDAVALLIEHALDAGDLASDSLEASVEFCLGLGVEHGVFSKGGGAAGEGGLDNSVNTPA